jgi:hypothetical protein
MNIDHEIFINQIAQGIVEFGDGERWFSAFDLESKRAVLRGINFMILQAHPTSEEAVSSIAASGLKQTLTPCVLLSKPGINVQLAKMANLPERELTDVFKLLVRFLGIADKRRRETTPLNTQSHWWHRDLGNQKVIAEIRANRQKGNDA